MTDVRLYQVNAPTKAKPKRRKWLLRWHGRDGKRYGDTIGIVGEMTKREAEAIQRQKQSEFDCDVAPVDKPQKMTLGDLVARHRERIEAEVAPRSLIVFDTSAWYALDCLGKATPVASVTSQHVYRLRNYLLAEGKTPEGRHRPPHGASTINRTMQGMSGMFKRAIAEGELHDNPFAGTVKKMKRQARTPRIFEPEEITAMTKAAPDDWWRLFIRVAVMTGLRRGELLNLMWSDVNAKDLTISVTRKDASRVEVGGTTLPILEFHAKSYEERTVPIDDETLEMLQRFRMVRQFAGESPYVFITIDRLRLIGARMTAGKWKVTSEIVGVNHGFQRIQETARSDASWVLGTPHDLRKTYGSRMAHHVPMNVLCEWMGHADMATTQKYYLAATRESADRARAALASFAGTDTELTRKAQSA